MKVNRTKTVKNINLIIRHLLNLQNAIGLEDKLIEIRVRRIIASISERLKDIIEEASSK